MGGGASPVDPGDSGVDSQAARWEPAALRLFGAELLEAAGMAPQQAKTVAAVAVEGDLLNHNTHGIRLLPTVLCVAVIHDVSICFYPVNASCI